MRRMLLSAGVVALLATGSAASARQSDTLIGDSRRQQGLESEMGRLRMGQTGGAREGVCPLVRGASAEVNTYVAARLRQVADQVGAEYAHRDCEPNVVVLFSPNPDELVAEATRAKRFNYRGVPPQEVERFKTSSQPVRWIHGSAAPGFKTRDARPYNALVIVDANKAADIKVSTLADYVSLVALADVRVRPAPDEGILNLFDSPASDAPQAMTEADRAYLRAVHSRRY
jgi:hypothetical protein